MLIQAPIPRTRFAITPTNVRPIHICQDKTPTRQFSNHHNIFNLTQKAEEKLHIRPLLENKNLQSIVIKQENNNRAHGNSFSQNQFNNKEMQTQILELTKQKDHMSQILHLILFQLLQSLYLQKQLIYLLSVSDAIRKSNILQKQLDKLQGEKTEQALQFQVNLDQFQEEITKLTNRLQFIFFYYTIEDLIIENSQLQESYQNQQFYINQLEYQENDQFNVTQQFGQM